MDILHGKPFPLGATYDGNGTNFSIFSESAEKIELCLFGDQQNEIHIEMPAVTGFCWHCYLPNILPGQKYGFRVHGEWNPDQGLLFNPAKLLLDPYAKSISGQFDWQEAVFPFYFDDDKKVKRNEMDSAPFTPRSVVIEPYFDWGNDRHPNIPLHDSIIYETHLKGFTVINPDIPDNLRGTYAGFAQPATIEYLKKLGITAVEFLPLHQFTHEVALTSRGLRNYWGYNPVGFFAPHNEYSSQNHFGAQVAEFKKMVKTLHEANIEVILDVVYNHTAEGNLWGPMLSLKGIDNKTYYILNNDNPREYIDYTGTGNTLDMSSPFVLQLVMDSLRYWVLEMHVDGFRFDLAAALARELHEIKKLSAFFDLIYQDPVISQVKLIAEPWDVGKGGYQVGNFPVLWSEWNGKYRDTMRDFWRGQNKSLEQFANRFLGSPDLYESTGRKPYASINFITAHDGFTLNDLVSYNEKHNENNPESSDGFDDNRSWNCGVEGKTDDKNVIALRDRQKRNFLITLFLSQGIPMLLSGDEIGRTQQGNNNAYCQDSEISWLDWKNADGQLLAFTEKLIKFRKIHPVFHHGSWLNKKNSPAKKEADAIIWLSCSGEILPDNHLQNNCAMAVMAFLDGGDIYYQNKFGKNINDDSFLFLFNANNEDIDFTLPEQTWSIKWQKVIDTASDFLDESREEFYHPKQQIKVANHSIFVLKQDKSDD